MVNRLQQPTHSYLARSRSAMSLSGDQTGNVKGPLLLLSVSRPIDPEEVVEFSQLYYITVLSARRVSAVYTKTS